MATLDELQAKLTALTQRVDEITTPPDDYYTHRFSGEEIDNAVGRVAATAGSGAITAGDVGAAPDGIISAIIRVSESENVDTYLDAAILAYYNAMKDFTISFVSLQLSFLSPTIGGAAWVFRFYRAGKDYGTITGESYEGKKVSRISRVVFSGVLGPWEWESPQMMLGIEYRTTERHNGKPVYTKLVDCGMMPNNGLKEITYSDDTNCRPISVKGTWGNGEITMPGENGSSGFPSLLQSISASRNKIIVVTHTDRSSYTSNATVKYWKTTN